ncbi:MAG: aminotransferase class I/II-fold pyridoxal phosphate-dependent enzyme [Clostridium sp.]|nr:aminotransferase class I/II-fold pyridoxal phosphate-dependent enzyme [Clostridium sp.]
MEQPILNGLTAYNTEGSYPWHMPGHKRRLDTIFPEQVANPFSIDVTEVGDLDEFHHPAGIIREAFDRAAEVYGSRQSYYLVNGSTCGILAAVSAVCRPGDTLIMARNCHQSVYHAVRLLRLKPVYIMPEWNDRLEMFGGILPDKVKKAIAEHPGAKAVILVSPTYEGVVSDVERLAKLCHKTDIPLIVDEAHGAHFEYMANVNETLSTTNYKKVPDPAIRLGADIVVESLHKTLPAMTQCSILHMRGNLVSRKRLEEFLSVYQSSSPSYIFMAATEACIEKMDHERDGLFILYKQLLMEYRKKFEEFTYIRLIGEEDFKKHGIYGYDDGKLVFSVKGCGLHTQDGIEPFTGPMLGGILANEYGQAVELAAGSYVIAMTSVADSKEAFEALYQALQIIDGQLIDLPENADMYNEECLYYHVLPERKMSIAEALDNDYSAVPFHDAAGRISGDYISIFPPEIPIAVPGEVISKDMIKGIKQALSQGLRVRGLAAADNGEHKITVVRENKWLSRRKWFNER